jgi:hypothetical protein
MNIALFYSSIIIGSIIIAISIYFYNPTLLPLYIITYIGIITSIINHGISSKAAKNLDRTIMLFSAAIYIYYGLKIQNKNIQLITLSIVALMMLLYLSSKIIKKFISSDSDNDSSANLATNIHAIVHLLSLLLFGIIIINEYLSKR